MRTEKDKMLAGELYDPLDAELVRAREWARDLCQELNATRERDQEARRRILAALFGRGGDSVWMQPPFYCDYGSNILLGERVFFNFNCVVLDVCLVEIGDFTLFGPAVQLYTATHSMNADLRERGHEKHPGRRVRRREPLPGYSGDHGVATPWRASPRPAEVQQFDVGRVHRAASCTARPSGAMRTSFAPQDAAQELRTLLRRGRREGEHGREWVPAFDCFCARRET